jgi:hypothetical protein
MFYVRIKVQKPRHGFISHLKLINAFKNQTATGDWKLAKNKLNFAYSARLYSVSFEGELIFQQ